jgi:hypothetical protein
MVGHLDGLPVDIAGQQFGERGGSLQRQPEHLVEVAVVQTPTPVDAYEFAAHDLFEVFRIVAGLEQLHVVGKLALGHQRAAEAQDGHVGQTVEPVEDDAVARLKLLLVGDLEPFLRRWQTGSERVVDQVQIQAAARLPVAQGIELPEAGDAALEHPLAALSIDVFLQIAGQ